MRLEQRESQRLQALAGDLGLQPWCKPPVRRVVMILDLFKVLLLQQYNRFFGIIKVMEIEKTNRMNALFEFYAALLTDKQMNYIELYYADDYSLAEIAEEFGVSRQAVYDNIKRTEKILEDYEMKLHMYSDYIVRSQIFDQILERYPKDDFLQEQIEVLTSIDNRE